MVTDPIYRYTDRSDRAWEVDPAKGIEKEVPLVPVNFVYEKPRPEEKP